MTYFIKIRNDITSRWHTSHAIFHHTAHRASAHHVSSQVRLLDADGRNISIVDAQNPGGQAVSIFEEASAAIDGSTQTKWLDTSFDGSAVRWGTP